MVDGAERSLMLGQEAMDWLLERYGRGGDQI
jgi:hypothetical protein